jgi:hypothetical protein
MKHQKLKIRAMTVKFMPLPAPNQSRLTGEPINPNVVNQPNTFVPGDIDDGFEDDSDSEF